MGTTWDAGAYAVFNKTDQNMVFTDCGLIHGKWAMNAVPVIAPNHDATPAFSAASHNDALVGPEGYLTYTLANGAALKISFDVPYLAGHFPSLKATLSGANSNLYHVETHLDWYPSNGGAGKRAEGTITLYSNS
jgi:hypothetical protein